MISMSKEEMINYLHDYAQIASLQTNQPNLPIGSCFNLYMTFNGRKEDNTKEYYDTMRTVYIIYCIMKLFSFSEDHTLNRDNNILESDLEDLKEGLNKIEGSTDISNKQLIRLIRNAFNHNNDPKFDRFKISKNAKNIEISFKDLRTPKEKAANKKEKPLNIKFNVDHLNKVLYNTVYNSRTTLYYGINLTDFNYSSKNIYKELDNIKITNYLFPEKLTREQKEKITDLQKEEYLSIEDIEKNGEELFNYIRSLAEPYDYKLTKEQKNKIEYFIKTDKKMRYEILDNNRIDMMNYYLEQSLPIAGFKQKSLYNQLLLVGGYQSVQNLSHMDVLDRISNIVYDTPIPSDYTIEEELLHEKFQAKGMKFQLYFLLDMMSRDFLEYLPTIMYLDSVITHYCTDETITIDNKTYETEKIRNSLVHGRWIISKDSKLVMYDADPRNKKSNDLEYVGSIKVNSLIKWSEKYVDSKKEKKSHVRIISLKK